MEQHLNKLWLLLLRQLDFQPLRGDLAQGVLETLVQVDRVAQEILEIHLVAQVVLVDLVAQVAQ